MNDRHESELSESDVHRPNFFIIGAPKCGTSSLINTLRGHPNIYVPLVFEPQYFCTDFFNDLSLEGYLRLFDGATKEHKAIGEKTVAYFYSEVAIDNILEFEPDARLILMLRNPTDLVYSWHAQLYYTFIEDIPDFQTAWSMQETRQAGNNIPDFCPVPMSLQYREMGKLGKYLKRLLVKAPREQLKIIFMEDFHKDSEAVYRECLEFLNVSYAPREDRRRLNLNKRHRFRWLGKLLAYNVDFPGSKTLNRLLRLPLVRRFPIKYWLHEFNKIEYKREPLPQELRRELTEEFRDDIGELAELTGRDLSHWLK